MSLKVLSLLIYINFAISSISYIDGDYWFPFPTVSYKYSNKSVLDISYLNWKIKERIKIKNNVIYPIFLDLKLIFHYFPKYPHYPCDEILLH